MLFFLPQPHSQFYSLERVLISSCAQFYGWQQFYVHTTNTLYKLKLVDLLQCLSFLFSHCVPLALFPALAQTLAHRPCVRWYPRRCVCTDTVLWLLVMPEMHLKWYDARQRVPRHRLARQKEQQQQQNRPTLSGAGLFSCPFLVCAVLRCKKG